MSPVSTTLRPGSRVAHHLLGPDLRAVHRDRLAALQTPEVAVVGYAEPAGGVDVEAPRSLWLDVGVAERLHPVLDLEGPHLEAIVLDALPRPELDQLDLVAKPAEDPLQRLEQSDQPGGPDDPQRRLPLHQVIGLEQPGQAQVVVGVEVGDVDLVDLDEPGRVDHLALGALPAVDQQPGASGADQHARGRPPRRGHGATGAEEDDREIHDAPSVESAGSAWRAPPPGPHLHFRA